MSKSYPCKGKEGVSVLDGRIVLSVQYGITGT